MLDNTKDRRDQTPMVETRLSQKTHLEQLSPDAERLSGTFGLNVNVSYPRELGGDPGARFQKYADVIFQEITRQLAQQHIPSIMGSHVGPEVRSFGIKPITTESEVIDNRPSNFLVRPSGTGAWQGREGFSIKLDVDMTVTTKTDRFVHRGESIFEARVAIGNFFAQKVVDSIRCSLSDGSSISSSFSTETELGKQFFNPKLHRDLFREDT